MHPLFSYPVRLPCWKLAVELGLPIRVSVLVAYAPESGVLSALCPDFDRRHPIRAEAKSVDALQRRLDDAFALELQRSFGKKPLMRPHLTVDMRLVARLPNLEKEGEQKDAGGPMLPRCCSARQFMKEDDKS